MTCCIRALLLAGLLCTELHAATERTETTRADISSARVVRIENMKFQPSTIQVGAGESIVFENHDLFPHTVTSVTKGQFDSGTIDSGKSWKLVPPHAGDMLFRCTFHPTMEGRIVVTGKASPSPSSKNHDAPPSSRR